MNTQIKNHTIVTSSNVICHQSFSHTAVDIRFDQASLHSLFELRVSCSGRLHHCVAVPEVRVGHND